MNDKISVIVPVYNAERFLTRCVNSILRQTHSNIELILVNDGSKDNSLALCQQLAAGDGRIIVLDKPNGGAASARNMGLDRATGEYIGFCDADDYLDSQMYSTLLSLLKKHNVQILDCGSEVLDEDGKQVTIDSCTGEFEVFSSSDYIRSIFLRTGNVHLGTKIFHTSVLQDIRIPEGRRVEDFYFTICCLQNVDKIGKCTNPFYKYTISSGSVTRSGGGSIYLDALYFYDLAVKLLGPQSGPMADAQSYYLLKMYYLLSISINRAEHKQYCKELQKCQKNLRSHRKDIRKNLHLSTKERIILYISCISMRLSRFLFCLKGGERK